MLLIALLSSFLCFAVVKQDKAPLKKAKKMTLREKLQSKKTKTTTSLPMQIKIL